MEKTLSTTKRIARIVSVYYFITGLGMLISADYFSKMIAHIGSDPVLINLSGMVHFFIGMTILVHHFRWRKPLEIVVSVLGFFFLLKGASLIIIPAMTLQTGSNPVQTHWGVSVGFMLVGLVVGFFAYFYKSKKDK